MNQTDYLAKALIGLITYLEGREVPDSIADDDVAALEEAFFYLRQCPELERERIVAAATQAAADSGEVHRRESMEAIIENISG